MHVIRLFTGDDGESHFEDIDVPLENFGDIGRISAVHPATGLVFREVDGDYDFDFHNAPRRQYVINLDSPVDIETGDGTRRRIEAGGILLAEDTTGRGHRSVAVDGKPRRCLFVTLD